MGRRSVWDDPETRAMRLRAIRAGRSGIGGDAMRERFGASANGNWRKWERQAVERGLIGAAR